jgi:hypothetical protein
MSSASIGAPSATPTVPAAPVDDDVAPTAAGEMSIGGGAAVVGTIFVFVRLAVWACDRLGVCACDPLSDAVRVGVRGARVGAVPFGEVPFGAGVDGPSPGAHVWFGASVAGLAVAVAPGAAVVDDAEGP